MPDTLRAERCLNGWWDFHPVLSEEGKKHLPPGPMPVDGWHNGKLIVPGSWTCGGYVPGLVAGTSEQEEAKPWIKWRMFDSYNNPPEWEQTYTGWLKRTFKLDKKTAGRRYKIHFGAILRESWIYLNGREIGRSLNGVLPVELDVTDTIRAGKNEVAVYCTDYRRDGQGKTFVPNGYDQLLVHNGIWQDVYLRSHADCHLEDITIRTSVREQELTILATITNQSTQGRDVSPSFAVKNNGMVELSIEGGRLSLEPGERKKIEITRSWKSYIPWNTQTPHLYHLETQLAEGRNVIDLQSDRFGFREIWIEGPHVLLNGDPCHMFGDWCHKSTFDVFQPAYIRQWFRMLKDCNMNYLRTHMFPHPPVLLDIADEMGILVCVESAFAFGGQMALDAEEFWKNTRVHIREMVSRDKNHPSVILWSVGNETRWSGNQSAVIKNGPGLRKLCEELDPTRIPYHDGDSTLWDEREQHLLSRHYGLESAGEGWWDKKQPLHVGEVGKWHYGQPHDNGIYGDDSMYASFAECHRAIAREAYDVIELARSNEVCCPFPWNLSGLDNYRPWPEEHRFEIKEPESPGFKILRTAAFTSEFSWWEPNGKGYAPGVGFELMKKAFRPLAVIVRERLSRFFDDATVKHTVSVVNDTGDIVRGDLRVRLFRGEKVLHEETGPVEIKNGRLYKKQFALPLVKLGEATDLIIVTDLSDTAQVYDRHERNLRVTPATERKREWKLPVVAILGDGPVKQILSDHKVKTLRVKSIDKVDIKKTPLLLIECNGVEAASKQNQELETFLAKGGRAVILEQSSCIFPVLDIDQKPVERCHIRGGQNDILAGLGAGDFEFWGEDPYAVMGSDSAVVRLPYRKPSKGNIRILLHSSYGDFGGEGMRFSPLFEYRSGKGTVIASQLRITDKAATHPVAHALIGRFLDYAAKYKARAICPVEAVGAVPAETLARIGVSTADVSSLVLVDGKAVPKKIALDLAARARKGATIFVSALDRGSVAVLAKAFDLEIKAVDLGNQYNLVRACDHELLEGVSQHETFWLDKVQYTYGVENRLMTDVLLESAQGQALLVSERESCWREFFTQDAMSEWLRMPVVTSLLWNGPRRSAAGLLEFPYGKGRLILCQIPLATDEYAKADCFWSHLLARAGASFGSPLLVGESVKAGSKCSDGFATALQTLCDPDETTFQEILKVGICTEIRMANAAISNGFPWVRMDNEQGEILLDTPAREVVMTYQLHAGRMRKAVPVEGGWPDPSQQTLLGLEGDGTVELYVNGRPYEAVHLGQAGSGTVADIDLDLVFNTVILRWKPEGGKRLASLWRNRQRQPEIEFLFLV